MTEIEKYYNKFNEENRLKTRHGQVEFNTTMHFIKQFAQKLILKRKENGEDEKLKILDIGAGTGRYSVELLNSGFDVTAVELVKKNLEVLRSKKTMVKTWQGNATNLNFLEDEKFDITLLLGPMYHLHSMEEKLKALEEAKRVTKKDGFIFIGYVMNEYAILKYCFVENRISSLMENNEITLDFHTKIDENGLYNYSRLEDLDEINEKGNVKRVLLFAPDGPADYMRRELNAMTEESFNYFKDYVLSISCRKELLGSSSHTVDVVQRG